MTESKSIISMEIEGKKNLIKLIEEGRNIKIDLKIDRGVTYGFNLTEVCSEEQMKKIIMIIESALSDNISQLIKKLQNHK